MSEAYTAQSATQALTEVAITAIVFQKNENGQYTRSAANQLLAQTRTTLKETFTTLESKKDGMEALLDEGSNIMTDIKTTSRGNFKNIMDTSKSAIFGNTQDNTHHA